MSDEYTKQENWDALSGCDFDEEFDDRFEAKDSRMESKKSRDSPWIAKLFPSLKIQKPGRDYYASTTIALVILVMYVFFTYKEFTASPEILEYNQGEASGGFPVGIFPPGQAIVITLMLVVIVVERYASRTDTKEEVSSRKRFSDGPEGEDETMYQSYLSSPNLYKNAAN